MYPRSIARKRNRLDYWDYSLPGYYFLTICCSNSACLLGEIETGLPRLSPLGLIAEEELLRSTQMRQELKLDSYVIMPNHIHLLAVLQTATEGRLAYARSPGHLEQRSVSAFVAGFKSSATSRGKHLLPTGFSSIWHRSFHDHIIRDEDGLLAIRQYILDNPAKWELDRLNPVLGPIQPDELDTLLASQARRPKLPV